jgi:hypothetical protein
MEQPDAYLPEGVDLDKPSIARIYDYFLGGNANWAIDREFGDTAIEQFPLIRPMAKANRQFLFRAVRHLVRIGVRQFVDLGAGIPTMGHTHSVAEDLAPGEARVVYVDNEPVAVAHAQILLEEQGDPRRHTAINSDLRAPEHLWRQIEHTGLIDFAQPVALLMIAVLHVQQRNEHGQDIGADIVSRYRNLLPPGSYLAVSHLTAEGVPHDVAQKMADVKALYDNSANPVIFRSHREIKDLFGDFELLPPGLTWTPEWHPEEAEPGQSPEQFDDPSEAATYAAVGRKPSGTR